MELKIVIDAGGSDLPAWIQAWGSIGAIAFSSIFAVVVPMHQRAVERRERLQSDRGVLMNSATRLSGVVAALADSLEKGKSPGPVMVGYYAGECQSHLTQLAVLGEDRLSPIAGGLVMTTRSVAHGLARLAEIAADPATHEKVADVLRKQEADLDRAAVTASELTPQKFLGGWRLAMPGEI